MRILTLFLVLIAGGAQAATEPRELVTAANAILCLSPDSLSEASQADVARNQRRLRGLSCMRTEAGIALIVLDNTDANAWKISFRPQGIPGGVTLWGRAGSFATPDGVPLYQRASR